MQFYNPRGIQKLKPAYLKENLEKSDEINSHVATGESYKYTNSLSMKSRDEKIA